MRRVNGVQYNPGWPLWLKVTVACAPVVFVLTALSIGCYW
jgi:hypothetical protein